MGGKGVGGRPRERERGGEGSVEGERVENVRSRYLLNCYEQLRTREERARKRAHFFSPIIEISR